MYFIETENLSHLSYSHQFRRYVYRPYRKEKMSSLERSGQYVVHSYASVCACIIYNTSMPTLTVLHTASLSRPRLQPEVINAANN